MVQRDDRFKVASPSPWRQSKQRAVWCPAGLLQLLPSCPEDQGLSLSRNQSESIQHKDSLSLSTPPPTLPVSFQQLLYKISSTRLKYAASFAISAFYWEGCFILFAPLRLNKHDGLGALLSNWLIIINCRQRHDHFAPLIITSFICQIFHFWERRGGDARVPAPLQDLLVNSEPLFRQA